jgi:hypothetical protein
MGQQHPRPLPAVVGPYKKRAIKENDWMEIQFPCVRVRLRQSSQDFRSLLYQQEDRRSREGDEETETRRFKRPNDVAEKPPGLLKPAPTTIYLGWFSTHDFSK